MIKDSDRALVEQLKSLLIKHGVPLYKMIVFGSRARGETEPDSDLDVLVAQSVACAVRTIHSCLFVRMAHHYISNEINVP